MIYINIQINNGIEIEIGTKIGREIRIENNIHFLSIDWHLVCVEIDFGIDIEMAGYFIFPISHVFAKPAGTLVGWDWDRSCCALVRSQVK